MELKTPDPGLVLWTIFSFAILACIIYVIVRLVKKYA